MWSVNAFVLFGCLLQQMAIKKGQTKYCCMHGTRTKLQHHPIRDTWVPINLFQKNILATKNIVCHTCYNRWSEHVSLDVGVLQACRVLNLLLMHILGKKIEQK